ncbi:hypothetical protein BGZ95_007619 [Linnemannia exigua]|uniref:Uncharacterized protein n=1 Tax=Linnemannia exigua TaxID=604196 RepID=A0AAD4H7R7_9FUNG|nr:hypothetical protein BGZ95_007619 [Linnemannia exigua]
MIHQIYSILSDHTTVDRTLAQLIKDGTIRKFYIGGTGSDEFAIMLIEDYILQIDQAKEQYLKDLAETQEKKNLTASSSAAKRKLDSTVAAAEAAHLSRGSHKRRGVVGSVAGAHTGSALTSTGASSPSPGGVDLTEEGEIFDRFKELVTAGHCMEISILHSNIQDVIGATDQDITTLIRYSLLNRGLSTPANPHLINLEAAVRHVNTSNSSSGGHSALNQLITATNQQHAKSIRADTPSSHPSSAAAGALVPTSGASSAAISGSVAATTVITDATARRERTSDDVAYRFAIRQGGVFVTHFLKGRLEILRMIKRQMFGDMLTSRPTAQIDTKR